MIAKSWVESLGDGPYEVSFSNENSRYPSVAVRVKTHAYSAQYNRELDPEIVVDDLTREMKKFLVARLGLESEVKHELFRKLISAAHTLPTDAANAVVPFLMETMYTEERGR